MLEPPGASRREYGRVRCFPGREGIAIEAGPFDPPLEFDRPLGADDDLFTVFGDAGTQLRIMFFRGPGGERFEVLQDNIKPL